MEVTDSSGEKKVFLLFTKISLERKWVDPIKKPVKTVPGETKPSVNKPSVNVSTPTNPSKKKVANDASSTTSGKPEDTNNAVPVVKPVKPAPSTRDQQPPKNPVPLTEDE